MSPGLFHVYLLLFSCSNQVLVITRFCLLQNSINLSPLSFLFPNPNFPTTLSSLPSSTTALKSPITITLSVPFVCLIFPLADHIVFRPPRLHSELSAGMLKLLPYPQDQLLPSPS